VPEDEAGLRLDQVIPRHVAGLSRRKAREVIDIGGAFVDGARVKIAGRLVRAGQTIEVNVGGALTREPVATAPTIVFADDHVIVVDKPAGLVTAPTPESDRGDLLDLLTRSHGEVYLVHRLDLPTSGLLVFARTRAANKQLADAFVRHDVDREYRAVVIGDVVPPAWARVESPARFTLDRPIDKRRAVTHIEIVEPLAGGATVIAARLDTGRTHQIRIHLAGIGNPVAGDRAHGGDLERTFIPRAPRLALHARLLGFAHPATGERVRFESALPDELARWIERLRYSP
jgi:23S rRNA pseudouridine1911/1915/1917 synthase